MEEQVQKPPVRNFSLIVVLMALLAYGIVLLAKFIGFGAEVVTADSIELIEQRIRPVADVYLSEANVPASVAVATEVSPAPPAAESDGPDGEKIYAGACFACHTTGAAGAPIPGSEEMSKRAAKGLDALLQSAMNGLNAMPPRGGRPDLSDEEIQAAIKFMLR